MMLRQTRKCSGLFRPVLAPDLEETRSIERFVALAAAIFTGVVLLQPVKASAVALEYSTYFGGSEDEGAAGVAVDAAGNMYIVGTTQSSDFPVTTGRPLLGGQDAYVAKFAPDGSLVYSTLVGGACEDYGNAVAVDAQGNAYITGRSDLCFNASTTAGVLVAKLNPAGTLVYINTFGGSLADVSAGHAIAVDEQGCAYITGYAGSASHDFPTTPGAFQTLECGGFLSDGFVAKLGPSGDAFVYSTFLCGTAYDAPRAIAIDQEGNAYVAGSTASHDFPIARPFQSEHHGTALNETGFVCKLNSTGSELVYSTYLGGSYETIVTSIAVDGQGNAYVTGETAGGDFPITAGVVQPIAPFAICISTICSDAFVAKFNPEGGVVFSTYLAGEGNDSGTGIAVDNFGSVYVAGSTASLNFPIRNALQWDNTGLDDIFLTQLNGEGNRILFSSLLGGGKAPGSSSLTEGTDELAGIALGKNGTIYLAGYSASLNFPITAGAYQPKSMGRSCFFGLSTCGDAFVAKVNPDALTPIPALHLDIDPNQSAPGGKTQVNWAGIDHPSPNDQVVLARLGERSGSTFDMGAFLTGGTPAGRMEVSLPDSLESGSYELRLMTRDPEFPALLKVVARSEPLTVRNSIRLELSLGLGREIRLRVEALSSGSYRIEATDRLKPGQWQLVATVRVEAQLPFEFTHEIEPGKPGRFYRVAK